MDNPAESREGLLDVEAVQKTLNRSRASVYRYANTEPGTLNPPYNSQKLNPELRLHHEDPLLFHPNEVARFARDVLGIKQVTVTVQPSPQTATISLLQEILAELKEIHQLLKSR